MYPHRAWDPGLDPHAGRGYGQPQPGQQAQGQNASVSWQDQVRGNPAAEYAALMRARSVEGAGGGAPTDAISQWMQHLEMGQAMDARGPGAGVMGSGYAPMGDPAVAYAAMMQAQTAPGQPPPAQMQLGAPALGAGWQGNTMNQMNAGQGMWPGDGMPAAGAPAVVAAMPMPYVQPTVPATDPTRLMFTPVAGTGAAAGNTMNTNAMTGGASAGDTRGREASPPRPTTPSARLAARVWGAKWLRALTVEEGTVHAELDGDEIRTLMKIRPDEVYPPAAFMDEAVKLCRASSGMRSAAIVKWTHKTFDTLVLLRSVAELIWPSRQSLDMQQLEQLRDAVIEAFPWSFNVVFEDDYEWPESGQTQAIASKRDIVVRAGARGARPTPASRGASVDWTSRHL